MNPEVKKEEIGYVVNWGADLGNGNQLSVSCNLPKGATQVIMNAEFDKLRLAFSRQQAKSASMGASQEIDQLVLRHKSAIDDLERLDTRSDAKGGLNAAERQQREAAVVHIDKLSKDIEFKRGVLNKLLEEAK